MPDEVSIWESAREGDADSFGALFREHRDRVYGHALRMTRSSHDAEDVAALVFLEAWRRRADVRLVNGSILAWLLVCTNFVAKNTARTARRHAIAMSKLPPQEDQGDHADLILDALDASGRERSIRAAFGRLSPKDQDILTLCVLNDFSLVDAAAAVGAPIGTVKARLSRAKKKLATLTRSTDWDATAPAIGGTK